MQDRLERELDQAGLLATPENPEPRPMEFSDVGSLPFLMAVIKEQMRMLPSFPGGTARTVTQPVSTSAPTKDAKMRWHLAKPSSGDAIRLVHAWSWLGMIGRVRCRACD